MYRQASLWTPSSSLILIFLFFAFFCLWCFLSDGCSSIVYILYTLYCMDINFSKVVFRVPNIAKRTRLRFLFFSFSIVPFNICKNEFEFLRSCQSISSIAQIEYDDIFRFLYGSTSSRLNCDITRVGCILFPYLPFQQNGKRQAVLTHCATILQPTVLLLYTAVIPNLLQTN